MGILAKWLEKKEAKKEFDASKAMVKADIDRYTKTLAQAEEKHAKLTELSTGTIDKEYFKTWNPTYLQSLQNNPQMLDSAIAEAQSDCTRWRLSLNTAQKTLALMRPNSKEDIAEREWVRNEFAKSLQEFDVTNSCDLRFHATTLVATKDIIQSGGIMSSADRLDGYLTSSDPSGIISASTKEHVQDSVNYWLDLNGNQGNRPCGCMFVVQPQSADESRMASARQMNNVMFKENPKQLIAIATTRENVDIVQSWLDAAGIDGPVVCQFEDLAFLLEYQRDEIIAPYDVSSTKDSKEIDQSRNDVGEDR